MPNVVKILTIDLEVGMYVSALDRPWLDTPFYLQGFLLEDREEIDRLQRYCDHVFVDPKLSKLPVNILSRKVRNQPRRTIQQILSPRVLKPYADTSDWAGEYPQALRAVYLLARGIEDIFARLASGGGLDLVRAKTSIEPMVESVVRNPDPCVWLARIRQEKRYFYQHALGCAVWAVALGRRLGLPRADLRSLAIGGMLFDVGKMAIDDELLNAPRALTEVEMQQVRSHVARGAELISDSALKNRDVIDMITAHHERLDGSGYPAGLRGDDIPVFGRIAGIVDFYDALTSHRGYAAALSPSEAVKMLHEKKGLEFQAELVEEFLQSVGIHPAGTLVELSSGEVAVVMAGSRTRRPRVMVLLGADKEPLAVPRTTNLADVQASGGHALQIVRSLSPGAHRVDLSTIPI